LYNSFAKWFYIIFYYQSNALLQSVPPRNS